MPESATTIYLTSEDTATLNFLSTMATNEAPAGAGVTPAPAVAVVQTTGTTVSAVQEAAKEGLVTTTIMPVPAETSGIPTPSATVVTSSKSDSTVASISAGPSTSSPGPAPAKTAATPAAKATPAAAGPAKAAATKTAAAKPDPATTKAGPASKTAPKAAPPGYKLIKVKNADGKIIVVKKKLTAEEIAAAENKGKSAKADRTASDQVKSVEYKIVSVPQVRVMFFVLCLVCPSRDSMLTHLRSPMAHWSR